MPKSIWIKSKAGNNAKTLVLAGSLLALLAVSTLYVPAVLVSIVASMLFFLAYLGIRVGVEKLLQPVYSVVLCYDHLQFHHRYGGWCLPWDKLQRIDIPRLHDGLNWHDMNYVGLRLNDPDYLLDSLSPRLSAHLLTEQRAALLASLRRSCQHCQDSHVSDHLIEDDYFKSASGKIYTGLTGMFANRMKKLRELTGYDLLIDQTILDREAEDFVALVRNYKNSAISHH
ncbi:DUF2982 domain-containing protein [Agarivorans sp. MS3-6]|uniref:DUF2982 domain-containing protein n=1 Tax=Agarivorans sp. TSD2052 TaxID=2937286 RepID=UPI00200F38AA|nr:DUF2982 domain-containing protein [Agarivorans sp. TSD2052]UPW16903.1 DUF2982 domain-containing protein [Agarivorans sp. TSD2052]